MEVKCCLQIFKKLNIKITIHIIFAEKTWAYNSIWFLGDEFLTKAEGAFNSKTGNEAAEEYYMKRNYNTKVFNNNRLSLN